MRQPEQPAPATGIGSSGKKTSTPVHDALVAAARHPRGQTVFVAGASIGASALWAAEQGAAVVAWLDSIAEASAIRAEFHSAGLPPPRISLAADFGDLDGGSCTESLIHLPRGTELQAELLHLAAAMVRPGGRIIFSGAVNEGIKGAVQGARRLLGQAGVVVRRGGCHAALAMCPPAGVSMPVVEPKETLAEVDGQPATLVWYSGVFAAGRVDAGAAALIEAMEVQPGERTLDLGCGLGVVGLAAQRRGAAVEATDVSSRAVASTRATLGANGYPDVPVHHDDLGASLTGGTFEVVLANPPFHKGHGVDFEVAQGFVRASRRLLRPGGRLYLVANAFLRYEAWLREQFEDVRSQWSDGSYRVWKCIR